jgi:hypothetical protein
MLVRLQFPDRERVIQDGDRLIAIGIGCPLSGCSAPLNHFTHRLNIGDTDRRL